MRLVARDVNLRVVRPLDQGVHRLLGSPLSDGDRVPRAKGLAVSSAYMHGDEPGIRLRASARSAAHNKKRVGASTLPSGRPVRNSRSRLLKPLTSKCARRYRRKAHIQAIRQSGRPAVADGYGGDDDPPCRRHDKSQTPSGHTVSLSLRPLAPSCVTGDAASCPELAAIVSSRLFSTERPSRKLTCSGGMCLQAVAT